MKRWQSYREAHDVTVDQLYSLGLFGVRSRRFQNEITVAIFACADRSRLPSLFEYTTSIPKAARKPSAEFHQRFLAADVCFPSFRHLHLRRRRGSIDTLEEASVYHDFSIPTLYNYPFLTRFKIIKLLLLFEMGFQIQSIDLRFKFCFRREEVYLLKIRRYRGKKTWLMTFEIRGKLATKYL